MNTLKKYTLLTLLAMLFSSTIQAQSSVSKGGFELHYNVFPSMFLTAEVAKIYKIKRSKNKGMINLSVTQEGANGPLGVEADIDVKANNLLGQNKIINLKKIAENDGAIYYIAVFNVAHREVVNFNVSAKPKDSKTRLEAKFNKEFYTD